jgi:para-nitrobenzyl esterase
MTPNIEKSGAGCFHASDLPVMMGKSNDFVKIEDPVSRRVGEKIRELWGEFAKTGKAPWAPFKDDEYIQPIK